MKERRLMLSYRMGDTGADRFGPPPKPNYGWVGVRSFWAKLEGGAYSSYYDQGVLQAKEDIDLGQTTNREALLSVEAHQRDIEWEALRDGFEYTLRKHDGTTLR